MAERKKASQGKAKVDKKAPAQKTKAKKVDPLEKLKLEVAEELGLLDKVKEKGWKGLSVAECGRVGGQMTRKMFAAKKEQAQEAQGKTPIE